jgi:hypothetical protein
MDRYGTEIQYYPKWNSRTNLNLPGSIVGIVTRSNDPNIPRAIFNLYDGLAYNGNDFKSVAHLDHLLYMLGDGPDLAQGISPPSRLPPQQGATAPPAGYPNNKLDPGVRDPSDSTKWAVPPEELSFTGDFILVSAGPDKAWGLSELYDPSNSNKGGANHKRSKVDDVYSIPPR